MKFGKKVSNITKKEYDSKPVHNEKYIKTKIKSYSGKISTNFHNNKIPEECKYVVKEKKKSKFITDDIEISSDDSDKEKSDEENSNEDWRKYKKVSGFASSLLKYQNFFKLWAQKFHFPKYKKVPFPEIRFFLGLIFLFFEPGLKSLNV